MSVKKVFGRKSKNRYELDAPPIAVTDSNATEILRAWASNEGLYVSLRPTAANLERVKSYIRNQVEHHSKKDFQTEYVELLELGGIEYDEKYLW